MHRVPAPLEGGGKMAELARKILMDEQDSHGRCKPYPKRRFCTLSAREKRRPLLARAAISKCNMVKVVKTKALATRKELPTGKNGRSK
jgi:hypothetical protein